MSTQTSVADQSVRKLLLELESELLALDGVRRLIAHAVGTPSELDGEDLGHIAHMIGERHDAMEEIFDGLWQQTAPTAPPCTASSASPVQSAQELAALRRALRRLAEVMTEKSKS